MGRKVPERLGGLIDKRLSVRDDVGVADGGKYPDLIERVFFLLRAQVHYLDSLECIDLVVLDAQSLVDCRVGPFA